MHFATTLTIFLSALVATVAAIPIPVAALAVIDNGSMLDLRRAEPVWSAASNKVSRSEDAHRSWTLRSLLTKREQSKETEEKREPKEPKRFSLDDFSTIAAANKRYDVQDVPQPAAPRKAAKAEAARLKQRGAKPGWSRIF